MVVATRRMTVAEFEQWQLPLDDAYRYDLWDGEVIEMAPAGARARSNWNRDRRL